MTTQYGPPLEFYRYEVRANSHGYIDQFDNYCSTFITYSLKEITYYIDKETPKGYWIKDDYNLFRRWIPKQSRKRFAYPTKAEALNNFIKRTKKRLGYLMRDVKACEYGLEKAKEMEE